MIELVQHDYNLRRWYHNYDDSCLHRPNGYYFWDETGTACYGPFGAEETCQIEMDKYALSLEP